MQESQPLAAAQEWQDLSFNETESAYLSGKFRTHLVRRARLVTYVSLAVTLAGGVSGIAAALALDRFVLPQHAHHLQHITHILLA